MSVRKRTSKTTGKVTWVAIAELGPDPATGERVQQWLGTFRTEREAKAAERAAMADIDRGIYVPPSRLTVAAYLTDWLASRNHAGGLRPASVEKYEQVIRVHIVPSLGTLELGKLKPRDITKLYAGMRANGVSEKTIRYTHTVLRAALNSAVKLQELSVNPAIPAAPETKIPKRAYTSWSIPEARRFLSVHAEHQWIHLWRLALYTTMRRSELLGLRWGDIDLEAGTLTVNNALVRDGSQGWTMSEPKAGKGRRILIALPALAGLHQQRTAQAEQRLRMGAAWLDLDLVFTKEDGRPLTTGTVYHTFLRLTAEAELPRVRFHDLRHTSASLLRSMGMDLTILQQVMGHSTFAMTADLYQHVELEEQRAAIERLAAALDG